MAGINIELKKSFSKKGIISYISSFSYSAFIVLGPLLYLVAVLLFCNRFLTFHGYKITEINFFIGTIVNAGMFSIIVMSIFNMLLTRYVSDYIFKKRYDRILPSLYGALSILLSLSLIIGVIWVYDAEVSIIYKILAVGLISFFVTSWIQMAYISCLKNHFVIFVGYIASIMVMIGMSFLLVDLFGMEIFISTLASVCMGFGTMIVILTYVLHRYLTFGKGSIFHFLKYIDKYPKLIIISFAWAVGALAHNAITWFGPYGSMEKNSFFFCNLYDWPSFCAYISILPALINFVVFVETKFHSFHKEYFDLIIGGGILQEINIAKKYLISTAMDQILSMAIVQFIITIVFVATGASIFPEMTAGMYGIYRVLCIGYYFYALANSIVVLLLYFDDQASAFKASVVFFILIVLLTFITIKYLDILFYGVSFVIACIVSLVVALYFFKEYLLVVNFRVFCSQPIFPTASTGYFTKLANKLDHLATNRTYVKEET